MTREELMLDVTRLVRELGVEGTLAALADFCHDVVDNTPASHPSTLRLYIGLEDSIRRCAKTAKHLIDKPMPTL